jgi:hypothetical protein
MLCLWLNQCVRDRCRHPFRTWRCLSARPNSRAEPKRSETSRRIARRTIASNAAKVGRYAWIAHPRKKRAAASFRHGHMAKVA